jgi:hypothetical protein
MTVLIVRGVGPVVRCDRCRAQVVARTTPTGPRPPRGWVSVSGPAGTAGPRHRCPTCRGER